MRKELTYQNSLHWDFIVEKIRQEQCVLVLGPEAYRPLKQESIHTVLLRSLDVERNPNVYKYYPDDEFYLFEERYKRTLVCHQIKAFYQSLPIPTNLEKLAKLPFHIYLTVTPDQCLQKAFEVQGFNYQAGYYKRNMLIWRGWGLRESSARTNESTKTSKCGSAQLDKSCKYP